MSHQPVSSQTVERNAAAAHPARGSKLLGAGLAVALLAAGSALLVDDLTSQAHAAVDHKDADYRLSSLRVFNRVVLLVKEQYVEPNRIHPKEMLLAALDAVEKSVPEVLIEEPVAGKASVGVVVGAERKDFALDDLTSLWELSFKLRDIFRFLETRISPEVDRRDVEYAAVNGMLTKLDPHSVLLEPKFSQEMKLSTKGEFGGLGIVISIRDGFLTVISPIDGTPADKVGVKAQDRIVKIGEESTINMGLDEAVERLRGKPHTDVVVWIERKGWEEPKKFVITRDIIKVDSVTHQLMDDKVGYVKVKQFQGRTADDVQAAVEDMEKTAGGKLKGLVLDLRNNPGGLLDQAVEVSNLFLNDGVIVVTQEGGVNGERKEIRASPRPGKIDLPLVVVVNGGSASASEIVAGAIKNRNRGVIVGDQTFGKGSVQQLYDFPDGSSLKLTIGQYLTPGDESIQSIGIAPDVEVRPILAADKENLNVFPDLHTREEDLESHLDDARIKHREPQFRVAYLSDVVADDENERREASSKFHDDYELKFVRRVMGLTRGASRQAILDASRVAIDQSRVEEQKKIDEALGKLGLDWSGGAEKGGKLTATIAVQPSVKSGESMAITINVRNDGAAPMYRVHGLSDATLGYLVDKEFLFGKIAPGETKSWTVDTKIPKDLTSRKDVVRVTFADGGAAPLGVLDVPVTIAGLERPRFSYALFIDDSQGGNGDGLVQIGESVELVAQIKNAGAGTAEEPTALLKNLGGAETFIQTGRQKLTALKPGASGIARFQFKVQSPTPEIEMRMQVFDGVMGDFLTEKLTFPVKDAVEVKKHKRTVEATQAVQVLAAADQGSPVVARADAGSRLDAVAEVGPFVRVKLGDQLYGYIASAGVGPAKGKAQLGAGGEPKGLSWVYGRDPPHVTFPGIDASKPISVDGGVFNLQAKIDDDGKVYDVYVFSNDQKVHYERLAKESGPARAGNGAGAAGATAALVKAAIQLKPGINVITVVAREDDEFAQREVLTVFSTQGDPLAEAMKHRRGR